MEVLNEFLVLGQIPGTNIQITFDELVAAFILAALLGAGYIFYKKQLFNNYLRQYILAARLKVQLFIESKEQRQLSLPL